MDIGTLKALGDVLAVVAFIAIAYWTFSPKNKRRFEEDAKMALLDDPLQSSDAVKKSDDTKTKDSMRD